MPDVLVQTRIPAELASRIAALAGSEGESLASWLRRLIFRGATMQLIHAWSAEKSHFDAVRPTLHDREPHYLLRPVETISATARVFAVYMSNGAPATRTVGVEAPPLVEPDRKRFVLCGSLNPWRVVTSMYDESSRLLLLTLEAEALEPLRAA